MSVPTVEEEPPIRDENSGISPKSLKSQKSLKSPGSGTPKLSPISSKEKSISDSEDPEVQPEVLKSKTSSMTSSKSPQGIEEKLSIKSESVLSDAVGIGIIIIIYFNNYI